LDEIFDCYVQHFSTSASQHFSGSAFQRIGRQS
jgi:hypothetical protein